MLQKDINHFFFSKYNQNTTYCFSKNSANHKNIMQYFMQVCGLKYWNLLLKKIMKKLSGKKFTLGKPYLTWAASPQTLQRKVVIWAG